MTLFINCHQLSKSFGSKQLFSNLSFGICKGDKIGLIGPNGSGKSTLLKIFYGLDQPDSGTLSSKKLLKIGYVPQVSEFPPLPLEQILINSMKIGESIDFHEKQTQVNILLSKLGFKNPLQSAETLSGGWKKRLDMAKALIDSPDLLLLDEPTNHLDLEGIIWLESFLRNESMTLLVTSHDRYFLDHVCTKTIELNPIYPDGLFSVEGNYSTFIERRKEFIQYQLQSERALASKVRTEIDWLRQSPKARTTKSSARIQQAERLIDELSEVRSRNKQSKAKIDFESTERETRKLLTTKNLSKSIGGHLLFSGVDLTLTQGTRLGIVGTNGSGKTTLLKLLAGEIVPDKGTLKYADEVKIVYFDQHRQLLNPNDTLRQALSPNSDTIIYRDQHIHVNSWAKRFLFSPDRIDLPIKQLSGGERARIGIARLMLQPADILLLDEPTNDLDIPTLETLEESLAEFPGAIAFITHDRALLDRLATCIIGVGVSPHPPLLADYQQWETYIKQNTAPLLPSKIKKNEEKKTFSTPSNPPSEKKLSYQEKRELESMESTILNLENEIFSLTTIVETLSTSGDLNELNTICEKIAISQKKLEKLFERWQELISNSV